MKLWNKSKDSDAVFFADTGFVKIGFMCVTEKIGDIKRGLYFRLPFGVSIVVNWPTNPTSDPNECWRPYLEKNVGRQCIHWDWELYSVDSPGNLTKIRIKFLRAKDATMFSLIYG